MLGKVVERANTLDEGLQNISPSRVDRLLGRSWLHPSCLCPSAFH